MLLLIRLFYSPNFPMSWFNLVKMVAQNIFGEQESLLENLGKSTIPKVENSHPLSVPNPAH